VSLQLRNSRQPELFSLIEQSITKVDSISCNVIYPSDGSEYVARRSTILSRWNTSFNVLLQWAALTNPGDKGAYKPSLKTFVIIGPNRDDGKDG
jgi:hypothetical protein